MKNTTYLQVLWLEFNLSYVVIYKTDSPMNDGSAGFRGTNNRITIKKKDKPMKSPNRFNQEFRHFTDNF